MNKVYIFLIIFTFAPIIHCLAQNAHPVNEEIDCSLCHTCLQPTKEDPCLVECPRESLHILPLERMGPDIVILDELSEVEDLYVPVRFNHETHAHMSSTQEGCEMCHHYNENQIRPASCVSCHPMEVLHENLAQPGLKGAYHRQCMDCHMEWDPNTSCEICHQKKSGGRLSGEAVTYSDERIYPEVQMRDLIIYESEDVGDVPFHHDTHANKYDRNCGDCHIQQGCEACHDQTVDVIKPMGELDMDQMHDHCFVCHGEAECEHCHGRDKDDVFIHEENTNWSLKAYHDPVHCRDCHTLRGEFTVLDTACNQCHRRGWELEEFDHASTNVALDEIHEMAECVDCHEESIKIIDERGYPQTAEIKTDCSSCHDEDRSYDPQKGFAGE